MFARVIVPVIVILIAVDIYALADIAMTARERIRSLNKFVWTIIVIGVTPIGAIMWFLLGKSHRSKAGEVFLAPDDDPNFRVPDTETADERIARLEEELRKLDDEDDDGKGTARD
jgi:hypothetical protein